LNQGVERRERPWFKSLSWRFCGEQRREPQNPTEGFERGQSQPAQGVERPSRTVWTWFKSLSWRFSTANDRGAIATRARTDAGRVTSDHPSLATGSTRPTTA